MRYNEIIINEDIDFTKLKKLKDCKIAIEKYKQGHIIYRGMKMKRDFFFSNDRGNRKSAFTTNYYNEWMSNDPSWAKYPKRNNSYICTSLEERAYEYQNPYIVLPVGNPNIGICSYNDIWYSFRFLRKKGISELHLINRYLECLGATPKYDSIIKTLEDLNVKFQQYKQENTDYFDLHPIEKQNKASEIRQANYRNLTLPIDKYYEILKKFEIKDEDSLLQPLYKEFIETGSTPEEIFRKWLSPNENEFKLVSLSSYNLTGNDNREIWFSGPTYFIKIDYKDQLTEYLNSI